MADAYALMIVSMYAWAPDLKIVALPGVYEHIRNQVSFSKHEPYFDVSTQRNVSSVKHTKM